MFNNIKKTVWKICKARYFRYKNSSQVEALKKLNFHSIENVLPQNSHKIGVVIPHLEPFGGGVTSIFRMGSGLSRRGFSVTYVTYGSQNENELEKNARQILRDFSGKVSSWENGKDLDFDIVIACDFMSVYYAAKLKGYKCVFVNDYEPLFYEAGDMYLLAEETYRKGFHLITLGTWCKDMIHKFISADLPIDSVAFPYEPKEYWDIKRDYSAYARKDTYRMCVYIRQTPRRLPLFCQSIAGELKALFEKDGKHLEVYYYGEEKRYHYLNGKCLGKLSKKELNELYASCDFGMVASFTNISLVPYEMMATGLPIIEFKAGSFEHFFDADDAFLYDLDTEKLYEQIRSAIASPAVLEARNERVQEKLRNLHWDQTIDQFAAILKGLAKNQ